MLTKKWKLKHPPPHYISYYYSLRFLHYLTGYATNLWTHCLNCPEQVLTVATLTCPSAPGNVSLIVASFQDMGGKLSSRSSTCIPGWRSGCLLCHLLHYCKLFKQSADHIFHNCWLKHWTCCHPDKLFIVVLVQSGSGRVVNGAPIKKWPGLKWLGSLGSLDSAMRSREFKHASICVIKVPNSSKVNNALLTVLFQSYFQNLTPASHSPPKCGEFRGMKCQWNCVFNAKLWTCLKNSSDLKYAFNSLLALPKLLPLSL